MDGKKETKRTSLVVRIRIIVIMTVIFSAGLICFVSLIQARRAIRHSTQQRMLDIVNCAAGSIDGDILGKITAEDKGTPEYQKIYDALAVFRDNIESEYVYGIRDEGDGRFTFTVDPALSDAAQFGEEVQWTEALQLASTGVPATDEEPYSDEWGTFYSAYSPVFDSQGNVAGIIAVDFSTRWYEGQQKEQAQITVMISLLVLIFTIFVALSFSHILLRNVTDPLKYMTEAAERFEQGDFSSELEIERQDEIGVLSRSLQSMAASLMEQQELDGALSGVRIAAVDDEAVSLTHTRTFLNKNGAKTICLKSGQDLLKYTERNIPDLILLDIVMPEMDGFETLRALREQEMRFNRIQTPVIFLTGADDSYTERRGLTEGASDFIRKPFDQEILLSRILNTIKNSKTIESLTEEATQDKLTGFLNKTNGTEKITALCENSKGVLAILDLDNFKLVNDLYGHDTGDRVLEHFAAIVRRNVRKADVVSRIGGDEFMAFFLDMKEEKNVANLTSRLNDQLMHHAELLMGEDFGIPLGISVGAVFVPENGTDYTELFQYADSALYHVKQNGKHGYDIYHHQEIEGDTGDNLDKDLYRVTRLVEERGAGKGAMLLGQDAFSLNYRFIIRFIRRYKEKANKLLFSIEQKEDGKNINKAVQSFGEVLQDTLRRSDIIFQSSSNRFFLLLPELSDQDVPSVLARIMNAWKKSEYHDLVEIRQTSELISYEEDEA